ncbi:M15 family metallopeptidase [Winogradskyella sp. PG-2]|uniref:M15 family metallopeptidase n=1 Tax=Winogradskyella sp. PG-2 TaxID=754409 RepID=UPI0004588DFC|nr:M15 family metallopeptidase [Winogradskyella sp. PG-2]BAO76972.1 D-alanyl-D-alanine carboxypeptidase [Winogradskyella sp. PG-2]
MKNLFILFSFILIHFSINTNTKHVIVNENIEIQINSTKTVDKLTPYITKDFVLGKFDYKQDSTFVKVNFKHSTKEVYLKNEVYTAFVSMLNSAKNAGIELKIISGTRNFKEQETIWERKWNRYKNLTPIARALKILEYSSMPCTSRHHWGTDIDLNSLNNSYFNSGKGLAEYNWLITHANSFGFHQVYTEKNKNRTGYNLEKWHWSYLPLASKYLEFYNSKIESIYINGFKGSELVEDLNIIEDYVNGVSDKVKNYK